MLVFHLQIGSPGAEKLGESLLKPLDKRVLAVFFFFVLVLVLVCLFVLRFFVRLKLPSGKRTGLARDTALRSCTVCECVLIDILNHFLS